MIVLVGFMGAGKTTVGRLLADHLHLPFVDTDELIERSEGSTVPEIFGSRGEAAFRTLERETIAGSIEGPEAVIALGGGALGDPVTCASISWHTVVHLDVTYPEAMKRVGHDPGRPMLHRSDPRELFDSRRIIYERVATHTVDTSGLAPEEVVARIVEVADLEVTAGPARIQVDLGPRSYPIFVGADLSHDVATLIDIDGCTHAFVVTHPSLATSAKPVLDSFMSSGIQAETLVVDEGETSKGLDVAGRVLEELAERRATRSDLVVAFGGGVVCDLAGFVASTYHRGMRILHVPTSLLAQVDAAIGGKTAVNLTRGKNLAGTIHQPVAVVCDVALLRSLPEEELRSGLAEVVKYGLIAEPDLLDVVTTSVGGLFERDEDLLASVVRRCAAIKAVVVSSDERETGRREVLNYGHTFGHAIEHVAHLRHGEAISVGMMAAAHLSVALGMLDEDDIERHRAPLAAAGLPLSTPLDLPATLETLKQDKKHRDGVRFVLLDAIGSPRSWVPATDEQILNALRKVTP